ncbi:MAG: sugar ABC transporter substrate-binding protein [Candidatus Limnocylindria bacterium]
MRMTKLTAVLAILALVLAACGQQATQTTAPEGGGDGARADITIEVVVHGQASDPFWSVVANGVEAAATDLGITANYRAPQSDDLDVVAMAQLIDTAVAAEPDGIIVSIPDADALREPIEAAIAAGIPVLSINSGSDVFKDLGLLTHVGQTEFEAGVGAGERMAAEGVTNTLCVNQEVGNAALDLRCEGFAEGLGGVPSEVIAVDLSDPASSQAAIEAALSADPSVDGMLTLGPTGAAPALLALEGNDAVKLATFDLSPEVLTAIDEGRMLFAIDQQQFLQGYMGVSIMTQFVQYGLLLGGGDVVRTGPGFVTGDTAAQVIELSAQGIR